MRGVYDNIFEVPKEDGSLATMVVRMEVIDVPDESKPEVDKLVRLRFEVAGGETNTPITIRDSLYIFDKSSSFFEYGYFTLKGSRKYLTDDRHSIWYRRRDNSKPIEIAELHQLPYTVEHIIPKYLLSWAKRDFGLKDGEQVSLHLNASAVEPHFWIPKSLDDLKDSKVFERGAGPQEGWEAAGYKVEIGLDPKLLHWDITQANCLITL